MPPSFATTRWTLVLHAADSRSGEGRAALEDLCRAYWQPLYSYVRGFGGTHEDAEDLTQAFFQQLLAKKLHARAEPERGRFRTFMLCSLRNFMSNQHRHDTVQKRGGSSARVSLDDTVAEMDGSLQDATTPEKMFERKFAHTVLAQALQQLADEQASESQKERFAILKPLLFDADHGATSDEKLAAQLGVSPSTVRSALARLRQRYRELVRAEVRQLVNDPEEVDDELAHLMRVLEG